MSVTHLGGYKIYLVFHRLISDAFCCLAFIQFCGLINDVLGLATFFPHLRHKNVNLLLGCLREIHHEPSIVRNVTFTFTQLKVWVRWKVASVQAAYLGFFETESSKRPCGILWLVMASGMRPCGILQLVMACGKRPSSRLWLVTDSGKRPCGIPLLIPTSRNGAQKWIGK